MSNSNSEEFPGFSRTYDPESPESADTPTSPLASLPKLHIQSSPVSSRNFTYPPWSRNSQLQFQRQLQIQALNPMVRRLGFSFTQNPNTVESQPLPDDLDRILSNLSLADIEHISKNKAALSNDLAKAQSDQSRSFPPLGPIAPPSQQQERPDQQQAQSLWPSSPARGLSSSIWSPGAAGVSPGWPTLPIRQQQVSPSSQWTSSQIHSSSPWSPQTNMSSSLFASSPPSAGHGSPSTHMQQKNINSPFSPMHQQPSRFQPMHAVLNSHNRLQPMPESSMFSAQPLSPSPGPSNRFSVHYHGMHNDSNASAEYLPESQNCALWLTNLPPKVTTSELLQSIRNIGRIWCTFINQPDNIMHMTAAAKVVFFNPEAAQKLLYQSCTEGLTVRGYRVKVSHNRIKYPAHQCIGKTSRVLIITGQSFFANKDSLTEYFGDRFVFQIDHVSQLVSAHGRSVIEYRFGSYRCQAQMGKMSLEKDRPLGFEKVEFGDDPCEVGDRLTSYGIAGERIQGIGL